MHFAGQGLDTLGQLLGHFRQAGVLLQQFQQLLSLSTSSEAQKCFEEDCYQ